MAASTLCSARTGTITVAGRTFTVTQEAIVCSYGINPASKSFAASSGTGSFSVNTQSCCAWSASSNVSWITITSGSSGTGNGTVSYSVAANTSTSQRSGNLTVAGKIFTVTQSGWVEYTLFEENFDTDPFSSGRWTVYDTSYVPVSGHVIYRNIYDANNPDACGPSTGYIYREYTGTRHVLHNPSFDTAGYQNIKLIFWYRNDSNTSIECKVAVGAEWISVATKGASPKDVYGHAIWQKVEVPLTSGTYNILFSMNATSDAMLRRVDCIKITGYK